jgi:aminopeptidase N
VKFPTLFFVLTMASRAVTLPESGVSEALARDRAASISDLHYVLSFNIPEHRADPVTGTVTIRFTLSTAQQVVLDFEQPRDHVHGLKVNDATVEAGFVNGHIVIPASATKAGENSLEVAFTAGDEALNRSDDFLYTLFVPARARLAFPCFDQPDLKGRYVVRLGLRSAGWSVVSNGAMQGSTFLGGNSLVTFAETPPLSTYLLAFAAGKFQVETAERNGRTFRMFHRETDAAKVARNRDALFDLHAKALAWLEDYTGIKYPWGKFDFVLIPSFQFGGMEHPGAIFYNASSVMLDESATQNQLLNRASTIAHETAHMWFGDLVTMRWFNDVWMKEVMANFMAAKIVNPSFPQVNHELRFLLSYYPAAYEVDRTAGANPIRQQLANLDEAGSLYGNIIYDKAPVVMRQLERILGEQNFRDGLRDYLKSFAFANATWLELIKILDDRTPEDLAAWSHIWVEQRGRPEIEATVTTDAQGRLDRIALKQHDPLKRGLLWPQQLEITLGYLNGIRGIETNLKGAVTNVTGHAGLLQPLYVLPTGGGLGYGGFVLDSASRQYFLDHLEDIPDALTRASALVVLWDELLESHVSPAEFLRMITRALPKETDEQNVQFMLGHLNDTYWKFLPQAERLKRAPALETLLRDGITRAATSSQKSAWFSAFRNVAQTQPGVEWLRRVWNRDEKIEGLPLVETDELALAGALAVREVPGWAKILSTQLERTKNPDRKARFEFVIPSLSADPKVREQSLERLRDVKNRRREPWVLESLGFLHHPLRADSSEHLIRASLDLLPEIQRTGDIFFPQRWADATLGGHRSAESAHIVHSFLDQSPKLPERLRWVVLTAADELFRASKMR